MKNSVPFYLALSSIKQDKKNYKISFVMMVIAFLIAFLFPSIIESYQQVKKESTARDYGNWSVCYHNLSKESKEFLSSNKLVESISDISYVGMLEDNDYIANYNSNFFKIASIELLEGRLPEFQNEIIALHSKGYSLNDKITVSYYTDQAIEKQYVVVGIMNDYNQKWTVPSPDYFTYQNEEYKNFIYVTSSLPLQDFEGFSPDSIYNFALLDNVVFEKDENVGFQGKSLEVDSYSNSYIVVVALGLLTAILSNIKDREKTVFLLRCIGMSHKDMKKYIFYEVIAIAILALGISAIIGLIILIGISSYVYVQFKLFLLFDLLILSLKYVAVIMILIVVITYISIFPISFRMMDSLIHKKERKQLKKYNRAKKMNVFNLARKLCNHHFVQINLIVSLVLIITGCVVVIKDSFPLVYENSEKVVQYEYQYEKIDPDFIDLHIASIINYKEYKMIDTNYNNRYGTCLSLEHLDYLLEEGRLPINNNECLVYDCNGVKNNKIGDKIHVQNTIYVEDEEEFFKEFMGVDYQYDKEGRVATLPIHSFTVVGIVNVDELYNDLQNNYRYTIGSDGIVILDKAINKIDIEWSSRTMIIANKDIYLDICDQQQNQVHSTFYLATVTSKTPYDTISTILLIGTIGIVDMYFLFIEIHILIDKMNRDLKLIRCLGLTVKQCMKIYWYIVGMIMFLSNSFLYLYTLVITTNALIFQEKNNSFLFAFSIMFIVLIFVISLIMMISYRKTNQTLEFYPTEVERYY